MTCMIAAMTDPTYSHHDLLIGNKLCNSHPQDHLLEGPESLVRPQAVCPCQVLCNNQPCIPVIRMGASSACTCSNLHHPASHSHPQTITYAPHPVDTRISLGLPQCMGMQSHVCFTVVADLRLPVGARNLIGWHSSVTCHPNNLHMPNMFVLHDCSSWHTWTTQMH